MTEEYKKQIILTLEEAVETETVNHDLYEFLAMMHFNSHYVHDLKDIDLYKTFMKGARTHREFGYSNSPMGFIIKSEDANIPVYKEHLRLYCKLVRVAQSGKKPIHEPVVGYQRMRERMARKYSELQPTKPTERLSTEHSKRYKKISKWKSSAVDDVARLVVRLQEYGLTLEEIY